MGRASRLKHNPDRERHRQAKHDEAAIKALREGGGSYAVTGTQTAEEMLQYAAMHEGGHVVAALALGLAVHFAHVITSKNRQGFTVGGYTELLLGNLADYDMDRERAQKAIHTPEMLRKRTTQALAGAIAEAMVNRAIDDVKTGAQDDDDRAMAFASIALQSTDPAELNTFCNECSDEAARLLTEHQSALIAVANHLLAHLNERVDGAVLRGIMTGGEVLS
jgi:hypothetical protein